MRIVQLANLYSPVSGGLRTAVDALGRGYVRAGHERVLVFPGPRPSVREGEHGTVITVPGPSVAPGYRFVLDPRPVLRVLERLKPQVVEVSDKATLTVAARWGRRHGVRSVLFSHERLDAILSSRVPFPGLLERGGDRWNRRLAGAFDAVVATSEFSAAEFLRVGAENVHLVPLGVDLRTFRPCFSRPGRPVRLVHLSRLSREKRPDLALAAVRELLRRGVDVRLDVIGEGNLRRPLARAARGLPVTFHGHLGSRAELARLLGTADVALATCPVESFGLAVLEALACGTPVVTADSGAARELLAPGAGVAVPASGRGFADGVERMLSRPVADRRAAARRRAEGYPWKAAVEGMIRVLSGGGDGYPGSGGTLKP
ncbi:glycosyltransferase [Actinocorallia populi]|uniref:glycosyltransferase n=1 Tax=Actinocorallia populi TaxID=2079200 RepID=UPI000D08CD74|nr:glycosyltransferase [Actinocorallia populi]